jgi:hypothetical protein
MSKFSFIYAQKTNGLTIPLDLFIDSTDGIAAVWANDKTLLRLIPCGDGTISIYCPNDEGFYALVTNLKKRLDGSGWKIDV